MAPQNGAVKRGFWAGPPDFLTRTKLNPGKPHING